MSREVTVSLQCPVSSIASVVIRSPEPPMHSVTIEDGCSVAVNLGTDDTETWSQKTGKWGDA